MFFPFTIKHLKIKIGFYKSTLAIHEKKNVNYELVWMKENYHFNLE